MYQEHQHDAQERTRPYNGQQTGRVFLHQFKHGGSSGRMVIFALIAGLLGVGVAAVSLALFLSYKGTTTTQIRQLREALASAQQSNQSNASSISGLSGKVSGIDGIVSIFAPYTTACSQALVNQSGGTGLYYYPCSAQRP